MRIDDHEHTCTPAATTFVFIMFHVEIGTDPDNDGQGGVSIKNDE